MARVVIAEPSAPISAALRKFLAGVAEVDDQLTESCTAAIVAWNGADLVLVPEDRPRVDSVVERMVEQLPHVRAPMPVNGSWPLLLINAVAGTIQPNVSNREHFPPTQRARIAALLISATRRPLPR